MLELSQTFLVRLRSFQELDLFFTVSLPGLYCVEVRSIMQSKSVLKGEGRNDLTVINKHSEAEPFRRSKRPFFIYNVPSLKLSRRKKTHCRSKHMCFKIYVAIKCILPPKSTLPTHTSLSFSLLS